MILLSFGPEAVVCCARFCGVGNNFRLFGLFAIHPIVGAAICRVANRLNGGSLNLLHCTSLFACCLYRMESGGVLVLQTVGINEIITVRMIV